MKDALVRPEKGRRSQREVLRVVGYPRPARQRETVVAEELQEGTFRCCAETWTRRRSHDVLAVAPFALCSAASVIADRDDSRGGCRGEVDAPPADRDGFWPRRVLRAPTMWGKYTLTRAARPTLTRKSPR